MNRCRLEAVLRNAGASSERPGGCSPQRRSGFQGARESALGRGRSRPVLGDYELVVVSEAVDAAAVAAGFDRFEYCLFDDLGIAVS